MNKKVELLAPAGNYEGFIGAVNAGADAVYLGGEKYSARAYADNFSDEEVIKAIHYGHLFGKKVYLTLNTLIKEKEFGDLEQYITPFYKAGLDGIIIQDLGVFRYVKQQFPDIELHVSTQMTVTGKYGARFLKDLGASRIVPARELSLKEIQTIKEEVDIEIEAFVHGAMCYCYSGQCLFSSMLGGRSGNRGRCAQPCRLPYEVIKEKKTVFQNPETYILSLKDMYTLPMIPQLIESGIDSFKIEGRMKKPEYAAGVTALYRKYIDLYYQNNNSNVSKDDINKMKALYIRSDLQTGYYEKHNGKDMVTLSKPSYSGSDDEILQQVRRDYIEIAKQIPLKCVISLQADTVAEITVTGCEFPYKEKSVTCYGDLVMEAKNRPLSKDDVLKQISKTGGTNFTFQEVIIEMGDSVFFGNSQLNQLRRDVITAFEDLLIKPYLREVVNNNGINNDYSDNNGINNDYVEQITELDEMKPTSIANGDKNKRKTTGISVLVSTKKQLDVIKGQEFISVGIESHCFYNELLSDKQRESTCKTSLKDENNKTETDDNTYVSDYLIQIQSPKYLALPYILREKDKKWLAVIKPFLKEPYFQGVLVRNLESVEWLKEIDYKGTIRTDGNVYVWNNKAKDFFQNLNISTTAPYELNLYELKDMNVKNTEMVVYGYLPLMITANCIKKSSIGCDYKDEWITLKDRYNTEFQVKNQCNFCYNIIYNSVPLSLHGLLKELKDLQFDSFRLVFTKENEQEIKTVVDYFKTIMEGNSGVVKMEPAYKEFTKGHLKRGVE